MKLLCLVFSAIFGYWAVIDSANASTSYKVTTLEGIGEGAPYGRAINNIGQVTGNAYTAADIPNAFIYSSGITTSLGTLGGTASWGTDINDRGQLTGVLAVPCQIYGTCFRGFLYTGGAAISIGSLGGDSTYGLSINNSGRITGVAFNTSGYARAFLSANGIMLNLGTLMGNDQTSGSNYSDGAAINNHGQITGSSGTSEGATHAFLYENGSMTDLGSLGGYENNSEGHALNDLGQVVGFSETASRDEHAFIYQNGSMIDLGTTAGTRLGTRSDANAINNNGQVTGYIEVNIGGQYISYGFLYTDGVMLDLTAQLDKTAGLGWRIHEGVDINDAGQILANAGNGTYFGAVILTPVPEPHSAILVIIGIFAILTIIHHKRNNANDQVGRIVQCSSAPTC